MTHIFGCQLFAGEDVTQVPAAGSAQDLGAVAVRIRQALDCIGDLLVKARPAAAGIELVA